MQMLPEVEPTEGRTGKRKGQIRFMASGIQFLRTKREQVLGVCAAGMIVARKWEIEDRFSRF